MIPKAIQPNLILSAEKDELGIAAGLMDRVAQVYEGLVYMDLSQDLMAEKGHGAYEPMESETLPRLYLAHHPTPTKVSGQLHSDLRTRWEQGDQEVRLTVSRIADLATEGRSALLDGDLERFSSLMDENFALRQQIMYVSEWDLSVAKAARSVGASAKLTGSGGAIIGAVENEEMLEGVRKELGLLGATVVEPQTR
jgi:glucuronokinase